MAIQSTYHDSCFELLVWKIVETPAYFIKELQISDTELATLQKQYKNPDALLQWLASRWSLQQLFNCSYKDFQKDTNGKLFLNKQEQLSISHSNPYIAVAKSSMPIGIDIQISNLKLQKIAHKYIENKTLSQIQTSNSYTDYLQLYWSIKEALFKAYGLGQVNFIEHLHIEPFEIETEGWTTAKIIKPNFEGNYKVFYQKQEDYYLCVVTKI